MATLQDRIKTRLRSLNEFDDIEVKTTKDSGQISIHHRLHHVPNFKFKWANDHYIGYFVLPDGSDSQAVVSLWTAFEAVKFIIMYSTMIDLRARREGGI